MCEKKKICKKATPKKPAKKLSLKSKASVGNLKFHNEIIGVEDSICNTVTSKYKNYDNTNQYKSLHIVISFQLVFSRKYCYKYKKT